MKTRRRLLAPPGEVVAIDKLQIAKARQFACYLETSGASAFAKLLEVRAQADLKAEVVVFSIEVERPQHLAHGIERVETLFAIFGASDERAPEVFSLRSDFPSVPHINLTDQEFPRSICIYELPYEQMRLTWTPANFLQRIHHWFAGTAKGTLHEKDQPLEPLLGTTGLRLILPADFDPAELASKPRPVLFYRVNAIGGDITLRAVWQDPHAKEKPDSVIAVFSCPPQTHGVIRRQPTNLRELQEICLPAGLDIAQQLTSTIRHWFLDKPSDGILKAKLVLLLYLPKTRQRGGQIESVETRAFLTNARVEEMGQSLGLLSKHGSVSGMMIGQAQVSPASLEKIPICLVQVHDALTPTRAALMNGVEPNHTRIVGVGVGALGSQVFNNLIRSGYGKWTLIDDDILLPHNCARHFLGDWAVGANKAHALAEIGKMVLGDQSLVEAIPANIFRPGDYATQVDNAFAHAELVLDMSASVAVSRHLSGLESKARHISLFVTPKGDGLVVACEDAGRKVRLNWLEMLHYRAVLGVSTLADSLQSKDARLRYGNSCRDVTTELAQDDVAVWAGVASKAIKCLSADSQAGLLIYTTALSGDVSATKIAAEVPRTLHLFDWTIEIDRWLLEKVALLRIERLPNETGGVLLGAFDTHRRVCSIVDVLPSPPDSKEWPTSYIRGCEGLACKVLAVQNQTLGQIGYVGEWHSHPAKASTHPSNDDMKAYGWLVSHMSAESLPAIMMIIGDHMNFRLVATNG